MKLKMLMLLYGTNFPTEEDVSFSPVHCVHGPYGSDSMSCDGPKRPRPFLPAGWFVCCRVLWGATWWPAPCCLLSSLPPQNPPLSCDWAPSVTDGAASDSEDPHHSSPPGPAAWDLPVVYDGGPAGCSWWAGEGRGRIEFLCPVLLFMTNKGVLLIPSFWLVSIIKRSQN